METAFGRNSFAGCMGFKSHVSQLPSVKVHFKPPPPKYNGTKIALLIEERPVKHITPLLLHMPYVVPPDWQLFYLGSLESLSIVNKSIAIQHHQIDGKLQLKTAPRKESYAPREQRNRMLTDVAFYKEYLPAAEWLFMYHTDSILCANAQSDLNDWLKYDWVGAPCYAHWSGGGGLSLRRVSRIQQVLNFQTRQDDADSEDRWLWDRVRLLPGVKLPKPEIEKMFAVEGVWDEKPMGFHMPSSSEILLKDVWDDPKQRKKTYEYCPEIKMIMNMKLERERCEEKTAEQVEAEKKAKEQMEKEINERMREAEEIRKKQEVQGEAAKMAEDENPPLLIYLTRPNPSASSNKPQIFTMSEKGQDESKEQPNQTTEEQEPPKEQKSYSEQDLTTFLSESQCKDFTLLVATITERMRRTIESNFDPLATLNKDLIGDPSQTDEEKINNADIDPGKVDVAAYEKEKKVLAEREKELSAPNVKQLKDDALANYDEWRLTFMKRIGEAVHLENEAEKQISDAAENYEPSTTPTAQQHTASGEAGEKVEQKAPKLEDLFLRVKTSLTKLSLAQRRLVLHSVLLLLISLERYTARSRILLLYLTSSLKLGTKALQEEEIKIAKGLLESAQQINADKETQEKIHASQQSRKWNIRAATIAGAAVVGITGGMAAPMVASGVGAVMGGLGLGATAAAGYLGSVAGSTYLVGALFGAYGGQMTGQMMDNLSREVEDFAFLPVHGRRKEFADESEAAAEEDRRLRVTIGITGWLTEKEEIVKPWRVLNTGSEVFALRWELETLINLGNSMKTMLSSAAWGYAQSQVIQKTVFAELMSSVTWPMGLAKVARVVDNPFTLGKTRADKAGEVLADALIHRAQGQRSVTLVGYSLGARAIYSCLMSLAKRKAFDLVESAILIGAPTPSNTASWRMLKTACSGRLINVYSTNDRVLAFLYRTSSIQYGIAGLAPIQGLSGVENVDVSEAVDGHLRYRFLIGKILSQIGLQDLDKEEIKHEEAAFEKMLAEEKEQDYVRQAKEKSQAYLGKKDVSDQDAEKEAGNMEKEIEQRNEKSMMQWASEQLYISRSTASDPDKAAEFGAKALKSGVNAVDDAYKNADRKSYYQSAKEKLYLSRSGSKNEDLAKEGISEVGPGYLTQAAMYAAQYLPSWHSASGKVADASSTATQTAAPAKGDEASKGYLASAASYLPHWSSSKPAEAETSGATEKVQEAASTASDAQQAATNQAGDAAKSGTDAASTTVENTTSTVGKVSKGTTDTVGSGINKGMSAAGAETVGEKTEEVINAVGKTPQNASRMVGDAGGGAVDKVGDGVQTGVQTAGKAPEQIGKGVGKGAESAKDGVEKVGEMTGADKGVEGVKDGANKVGETATQGAEGLKNGARKVGESTGLDKGAEAATGSASALGDKVGEGAQAGQDAVGKGAETATGAASKVGESTGLDKGAETATDTVSSAGSKVGEGAQAGQDAVGKGAETATEAASKVGETTGLDKGAEAAGKVGEGAQDAVSGVGEKTGISKGLGKAKFW
ncbi:MAG: hypothetical protein Q9170_007778 [Blastenia crenularia]